MKSTMTKGEEAILTITSRQIDPERFRLLLRIQQCRNVDAILILVRGRWVQIRAKAG